MTNFMYAMLARKDFHFQVAHRRTNEHVNVETNLLNAMSATNSF
jgi:hypothetical protein